MFTPQYIVLLHLFKTLIDSFNFLLSLLNHIIAVATASCDKGIGIFNFLPSKNYFITGATGMIGKALVEKMFRSTPSVGMIFLLIKANDMDDAIKRLKTEIIGAELFGRIKEKYGENYEQFMIEKIVPVVGNISQNNLGMDLNQANAIAEQVHVIIHSAACTSFDERYDIALNINTKGPARVLEFAKKCKKLRLLLHISTAYVNGEREGIIKEEAFKMGHCIAWERDSAQSKIPPLDINGEIKLAKEMVNSFGNTLQGIERMKQWEMQRAKMHGWKNTYEFIKAMGEMLLNSQRENVTIVILRLSIVESAYAQPYPGWIQGNRMMDPTIISYGKNRLAGLLGDREVVIDIVPLDMVVNATIAVMAKHGSQEKLSEMKIYHIASSNTNPVTNGEVFDSVFDSYAASPLLDSKGTMIQVEKLRFFSTTDAYVAHLRQIIITKNGASGIESHRTVQKHLHVATLMADYSFYKGRFDDENTRKLLEEMSIGEKQTFEFDMKCINWKYYIKNVHIPGIRRYVLKEPNNNISKP